MTEEDRMDKTASKAERERHLNDRRRWLALLLVAARALQGVGGAIIAPAALSIIITTFTEAESRARAMGVWAFVVSGGASVGVLLGGVLTQTMGWPWIFFVNLPVGLAALALCRPLLDPDPKRAARGPGAPGGFDLPGAFLVTT